MAVIRTAHRLGISSLLEPNASIALGTSEVSVLELVGAYAPFANGGYAVVPHVIERIKGENGKVLYTHSDQQLGRIIEARYVDMMNTMMQETLTIGTAHKATLPAGRRPARPARHRISATPGSLATPRSWSPASGSAMTTVRRPKRSPAAACRPRSGAA